MNLCSSYLISAYFLGWDQIFSGIYRKFSFYCLWMDEFLLLHKVSFVKLEKNSKLSFLILVFIVKSFDQKQLYFLSHNIDESEILISNGVDPCQMWTNSTVYIWIAVFVPESNSNQFIFICRNESAAIVQKREIALGWPICTDHVVIDIYSIQILQSFPAQIQCHNLGLIILQCTWWLALK